MAPSPKQDSPTARSPASAWRSASVGDLLSGATVAVTSLPQYIAYAEMAGLPGLHGLAASGPPIVAFAMVTRSPVLSIGVTSITALMANSLLGGSEFKAAHGEEAWVAMLAAFSMLVGAASLVLWLLGAARLFRLIPVAVQEGWKLGFAVTVVASQAAPALFHTGARHVAVKCPPLDPSALLGPRADGAVIPAGAVGMHRLIWMLTHPAEWHPDTAVLAALTIAAILIGEPALRAACRVVTRNPKAKPVAGLEVVLATVLGTVLAIWLGYAGGVVGAVPSAAPSTAVALPGGSGGGGGAGATAATAALGWVKVWPQDMPFAELAERLGGWPMTALRAVVFASVDFLAIVSVVGTEQTGPELAGQGVGCLVSGIAGSAPVGGSLSRSLVAQLTGASSPLAGLVNGLVTLALSLPAISSLLAPVPKAILSAVVLAAVLPGVLRPRRVLALGGRAAVVAWVTLAATTLTDPTVGFACGLAAHAVMRPQRGGVKRE